MIKDTIAVRCRYQKKGYKYLVEVDINGFCELKLIINHSMCTWFRSFRIMETDGIS
jgi:cytidylate kinase